MSKHSKILFRRGEMLSHRFGGWGLRFTRRRRAYNVSGNRGVRLDCAIAKLLEQGE
jgi:hypothetical protein